MAGNNSPKKTPKSNNLKPAWEKGQSGNPAGRREGSRNKATIALESLLDGQAEALTQKAVDLALGGDIAALRLCLERILPPRKSRPIEIDLPPVETADDIAAAHGAVIAAMARGEITPDDAGTIAGVLEARRRTIETVDLEARIIALEKSSSK